MADLRYTRPSSATTTKEGVNQMIFTAMTESEAYDLEEALHEMEMEAAQERWYESGGPHADRIQAEDALELEREANDFGLQALRA